MACSYQHDVAVLPVVQDAHHVIDMVYVLAVKIEAPGGCLSRPDSKKMEKVI
jgi:hypothetical protein